MISQLSPRAKQFATDPIAVFIYWPLARLCWLGERVGLNMRSMPLYTYRHLSFYTMRTDSRDRFGTPLEQRFTRSEIGAMMASVGLEEIHFSDTEPYWCAIGYKHTAEAL